MNTIPRRQRLRLSNHLLVLLVALFCLSIVAAYALPSLPMAAQIIAHITTIVLSAMIKLCYLARIQAQHSLGLKVC
ncbi:MAG: hypothetical protein ACRBBW_18825 [Cellvibrionaceae bacterium]